MARPLFQSHVMSLTHRLSGVCADAMRLACGVGLGAALAAVVVAAPVSALAQTEVAPAAAPPSDGPALWVARDADSTVYLFGTMHLLRPGMEWRTPTVSAALDASDTVWMEIADIDDPAAIAPIMQARGVSPDRPLSSLLSPQELAALDGVARQLGGTTEALDPLRPWFAALQISVAAIVKAGFDPSSGVELQLTAAADAAGKSVQGLETPAEQIGYLADLPDPIQVQFLNSSIAEFNNAEAELNALVQAWSTGDVDTLATRFVTDFEAEFPEVHDAILVRRNAAWTETLAEVMDGSGTAFVAVGALHLAGDDSVQAMLRQRGITVERVAALAD